ncbi:hypothetical protein JOC36_000779 [Weissella uvarum]|uniref:hypothetical protein n=1 Tax=Weissella uvarum TaxID=1479233 RepID=UPI00195FD1B2|nr:hypothetical protein [Weissella uvarum]MBM7617230.1 hypothetical protein [Weissella uvarum]MCM0595523.1 hypothetical protein [Weissella uvarum]
MADYTENQEKIIENIADTLKKLDDNVADLGGLKMDPKSHSVKEWVEEHKALHEIKHIMSEIGKYGKFDEKQAQEDEKKFEEYVESLQDNH